MISGVKGSCFRGEGESEGRVREDEGGVVGEETF